MGSSFDLARYFNINLSVVWLPEELAAAKKEILFDNYFINKFFIEEEYVQHKLNVKLDSICEGLHVDSDKNIITLRGSNLGEQHFMPKVKDLFNNPKYKDYTLIIKAGGNFTLNNQHTFFNNKRDFYKSIDFHPQILENVGNPLFAERYLGLHLRNTDRALDSPTINQIIKSLLILSKKSSCQTVYISYDNFIEFATLNKKLKRLNFNVISSDPPDLDRRQPQAGVWALVDFLLLSRSISQIYHVKSSFSQESRILNLKPECSIGLLAPVHIQFYRNLSRVTTDAKKKVLMFYR